MASPRSCLLVTGASITLFRRADANDSIKIEIEPNHPVVVNAEPLDKIGQRSFGLQKDIGLIDGILGENFLRRFRDVRIELQGGLS